jgi:TetR/AcrR family transcriptional regulator, transcriptional repressor of bet genes
MDDRPKFRRETSEQRQRTLIEATLRCLAEGSIDRLSVRTIAAEAGVSVGLINHHYSSKEALIAAAYRRAADDLLAGLAAAVEKAPGDPRQRLAAFFRDSFSPRVLDPKLLKMWTAFWTMADRSPEVQAVHEATYAEYRALLERLLADLAGDAGSGFDVRLAAIGLTALLDGLWLELCLNPKTFSPEEGVKLCEAWVETHLAGRLAKHAPSRSQATPAQRKSAAGKRR